MTAASKGPRYAPEDPTLPKPWRELIDGSTGNHYYWNPETSVTQYERPVVESLPPPPPGPPPAVRSRSRGDDARHAPSRGHQSSRSAARVHAASDGGSGLSAEAYRRQHEISVAGDEVPAPFTSFESAGFPSEILKEVHHAGFSAPTPIQAQSWPIAMKGYDVVAIAKTGSGKTLGYLIPAFIHIKNRRNNPRMGPTVLVLAPTRELATQIQDEAEKFGRTSRIASTCLYGGAPKGPQLRDLDRGVDVIVATPGRLNDILEMRRVSLRQVSYLVLDEADRMLDMGFEPQIMKIVKEIPQRRQTLMFTATWPREVKKIAADLLAHPIQVNIGGTDELVANKAITQFVEVITATGKQRRLEQILQSQDPDSKVIIFCSTKRMCDQLARTLDRRFGAAAIHGDKSQGERDRVLNQFRTGRSPILVATDVASRGLDIKDIRVVVNYDFPTDIEDYVHRIGRTGRAGATGVSYTFFSDKDSRYAPDLIKVLEGSKQKVPLELRDLVKHGRRGGGRNGKRRWRSISGRDGGRSNSRRDDSSYGGRGGYGLLPYGGADSRHGPRGYSDDELDDRYARGHELDKRDSKGALISTDRRTRGRSPSRSRSRSRSRSWTSNRSRSFSPTPKRRRVEHVNSRSRSRDNSQSGRSPSRSVSPGLDRGAGSAYRHSPSRRPEPAREHNKASHPVRSPLPSSSQQSQQQKSPPYDDDYEDTKDAEQNRSPSPWKEKSGSPFHGVVNGKQGESTSPVKSNQNMSPEYHGDDVVEARGKQLVTEAQNVANIGEEGTISQSVVSPKKIRDSGEVEEGMIPQDEDGPIPQDKRTASPGIRTAQESDGEVKANADGCT